jgi:dTDP-4-amino-4,6-dideoxygalactose transaminase
MKISFAPPDLNQEDINEVIQVIKSGWITTGPKTKEFERNIAKHCNTTHAACLSSQTAAAEMTLRLLGIGPGDQVIVPAYTYTATVSVVCHLGATPVIVDSAPNSYFMDHTQLAAAITPKTKAIIPVDIAGILCDYQAIYHAINAKKHLFQPSPNKYQQAFNRIILVADSAHAFGATQNGKMAGQIADFTNFSFHAVKNLTTGEGGAATWLPIEGIPSEDIYKELMLLSLHGQSKDALEKLTGTWEYDIIAPYYKCNMTDIHAALGVSQLRRYPALLARRKEIIQRYDNAFKAMPFQLLQHFTQNSSSNGHLYFIRLTGKSQDFRNLFIREMANAGISCNVHYKPLPMLSAYANLGFHIKDYPNAYAMYENSLTLPLHTCLTDDQVGYIIESVIKIYNQLS